VKKSEITKEILFETASKMIAELGFEKATMRAIAKEAGVASGAAYYYFKSKEEFVYEYYKRSHEEHIKELGDFLNKEKSLEKRIHRVVTLKMQLAQPYKKMARALYRIAANPDSPLSPFSEESKKLRLESLAIFKEVVAGSNEKIHDDFKDIFPEFLWYFQMGIILFWIYDKSEEANKTFKFIDSSTSLIVSLNKAFMNPLAKPFRKSIANLMQDFIPKEQA
tara:strand:- start:2772 stop:3437 length:666 start_codon:yes stop_codon:yes gene_type:complete